MQLTDTHCHIHSADYALDVAEIERHARQAGVDYLLCVGTDASDSQLAVDFVQKHDRHFAAIGLHPHDAVDAETSLPKLRELATRPKVVAIGECGLDYFYEHSPRKIQQQCLRQHIELALERNLPLIFHVRDAFDDFWPIFDSYNGLRGVLHSFTDSQENLDKALDRGFFIGVNGIMTFTKNAWQLEVTKNIPADKLLLETDAPFLTPAPLRGKVNEPAHVLLVAKFLANLRDMSPYQIAEITTRNARQLFSI